MINGFVVKVLSSSRVKDIIPPVVPLLGAYSIGGVNCAYTDCHTPNSVEFTDFPPHCQAGTSEANTIPELAICHLPSLSGRLQELAQCLHGTGLGEWLEAHSHYSAIVIVGDCTDLSAPDGIAQNLCQCAQFKMRDCARMLCRP
jgi:nicotinamidase-related amidase